MPKTNVRSIGKAGAFTSWIVKKSALRKMTGGTMRDCQTNIESDIDNGKATWLQLQKVIQNIPGKGIATILGTIQGTDVVVKAQETGEANKEYAMQAKLADLPGFVQYHCLFTCHVAKDYIQSFATVNEQKMLCTAKGNSMGVIVMPYYKNGSFEEVLKRASLDKDKCINIWKAIIVNYVGAYNAKEMTHGDFFTKNVVLDDDMQPFILDFEKSQFNAERRRDMFWNDMDNMCLDLSRYTAFSSQIYDVARVLTIHRAYGQEPTPEIIRDLLAAIDRL